MPEKQSKLKNTFLSFSIFFQFDEIIYLQMNPLSKKDYKPTYKKIAKTFYVQKNLKMLLRYVILF
ncbi:hypothetical protein BZG01_07695 [Labilibaculum manganireducens]|uniref:Uncharacterized protein n=1 Tax=Labilibaculum manganireducens TaxID=1940525 RepID=A0A2N3IAF4_9BACT|nr:hypothetical protein BZG01_07695 [Labilibaculum manganireducens]